MRGALRGARSSVVCPPRSSRRSEAGAEVGVAAVAHAGAAALAGVPGRAHHPVVHAVRVAIAEGVETSIGLNERAADVAGSAAALTLKRVRAIVEAPRLTVSNTE